MAEWLFKPLVVGFALWMGWSLLRPRYAFEIRVEDGKPTVRAGKVTRAYLARVADVCRTDGVDHGRIGGLPRGGRTALRFSRDFPPGVRQRLRNEWVMMG